AARLESLGAAATAPGEAMRVDGPADHPAYAGPLRRALAALAPSLMGFDGDGAAPESAEDRALRPARAAALLLLGKLLGARAFGTSIDATEAGQPAIAVLPTRQPTLRITVA